MKTTCFLWLALIAAGMLPSSSQAVLTNVWPFTTPAQYTVSKSNDIEVADGVAKLKLLSLDRHDVSLSSYLRTGTVQTAVGVGPDVSIVLKKSGSLYASRGVFTSRVLDGGIGNIWQNILAQSYNIKLENAGGGLQGGETGLVGLWHLDGSWVDSSPTARNGTAVGSTFSTRAQIGSRSGQFNSSTYTTFGSVPLSDRVTISMWVNMSWVAYESFALSIVGAGDAPILGVRVGGSYDHYYGPPNCIAVFSDGYSGAGTASGVFGSSEIGIWRHILITYQNRGWSDINIYKDGVYQPLYRNSFVTKNLGNSGFHLGVRYDRQLGFGGLIDEVAIYDRVLTQNEIMELYNKPRSLWMQVRSGDLPDVVQSSSFVGPDGTTNTYYSGLYDALQSGGGFYTWHRYAQYRAFLYGPSSGSDTPYLDSAGLIGTRAYAFDNTLGDFSRGDLSQNVSNYPSYFDTPYLGLAKTDNGGYHTNGTYTSRVLDGGGPQFWYSVAWSIPEELTLGDSSLLALWHMNGGWSDGTGQGYNGAPFDVGYDNRAKFGSQACLFNGISSYVQIGGLASKTVRALEFWIRDDNVNDGILELVSNATSRVYLSVSNRLVIPVGFNAYSPTLYINGQSLSRQLQSGWNHVALTLDKGITPTQFLVGTAKGDYLDGLLDEMAVYSRVLSGAEVKGHFVAGRRISAGRAKLQARAGDTLPLTSEFVGASDTPGSYITDNTGGGGLRQSARFGH